MTDEERQKCCAELRTADELSFYWRKLAADEIERLTQELLITGGALEICQDELNMAFEQIERLAAELKEKQLKRRRPIYEEALLREARPYVASARGDDTETHNFVDGLLRDIDAVITQSPKARLASDPQRREIKRLTARVSELERKQAW